MIDCRLMNLEWLVDNSHSDRIGKMRTYWKLDSTSVPTESTMYVTKGELSNMVCSEREIKGEIRIVLTICIRLDW